MGDMERSLSFYRDALGLQVFSPPELSVKFFRLNEESSGVPQQIVLVPRPSGKFRAAREKSKGDLHHIGLEVASEDFKAFRLHLENWGFQTRDGEHPFLAVKAFYIDDPDGNEVEVVTACD